MEGGRTEGGIETIFGVPARDESGVRESEVDGEEAYEEGALASSIKYKVYSIK